MTKFILVASGKGGVGKTTVAINLGCALAKLGYETIVCDANLNTPNVSLYLGAPIISVALQDALRGTQSLEQAAYQHASGLKVIPARVSIHELDSVNHQRLPSVIGGLNGYADYVIIDSAPGLMDDVRSLLRIADDIIVVTTAETASMTDTLKMVAFANKHKKNVKGVVVNRLHHDRFDVDLASIQETLESEILGIVPEDKFVRRAFFHKHPVIYSHPYAKSSMAFAKLAMRISGNPVEISVIDRVKSYIHNAFNISRF